MPILQSDLNPGSMHREPSRSRVHGEPRPATRACHFQYVILSDRRERRICVLGIKKTEILRRSAPQNDELSGSYLRDEMPEQYLRNETSELYLRDEQSELYQRGVQ
jgi:hypothetical protein